MRPLTKWPGGQSKAARWIISHFVEHSVYCEPFGGGLNVLLNKPCCGVEFVGDLHPQLMNLYGVLKDSVKLEQFCRGLERVAYSEQVFDVARGLCPRDPVLGSVRDAILFYITHRMSRNGQGKSFSWTRSGRLRGGRHGDVNAWETMKPLVREIGFRLRGVELVRGLALPLMARAAGPDTVFYCDPPFLHESRSSKNKLLYGEFEMSTEDHVALLDFIVQVPAAGVYISCYPNDLYRERLGGAGWDLAKRFFSNNMATGVDKGVKEAWLFFRH